MILSVSLLTPYTLVCTVAAVIFLAIEPLTDAFFPLSSAYDAVGDQSRLKHLLMRGTKIVMAISLPLAVAVAAYGEDFIVGWIGDARVTAPAGVMPLIVASFTVTAFVLTASTILLALARVKEVFFMGIAELALAVGFVLTAVPRLGLAGLAGSLLVANALVTFVWIVPYTCRLLGQSPTDFLSQALIRPLLPVVPMAACRTLAQRPGPRRLPSVAGLQVGCGGLRLPRRLLRSFPDGRGTTPVSHRHSNSPGKRTEMSEPR